MASQLRIGVEARRSGVEAAGRQALPRSLDA